MIDSENQTHDANEWSSKTPTEFEPTSRIISNHVLDAVVETIDTETPRNGDTLEKDEPKKNQVAASVRVEQLEDVHATLRPTRMPLMTK